MDISNSSLSSATQDSPSVNTLRTVYADKQVGDFFKFGRYPQEIIKEFDPITWQVLQRNADHLLVIAKQGLDCKRYHEELCGITWADCTMRHWLNSEFMNVAFNEQERKCILKTNIVNSSGPNTEDCIFLLSVDEVKSLFDNYRARRVKPTIYALSNGVFQDRRTGYCDWWLRSRGITFSHAACVGAGGGVKEGYCVIGGAISYAGGSVAPSGLCAVRPAIKLAL